MAYCFALLAFTTGLQDRTGVFTCEKSMYSYFLSFSLFCGAYTAMFITVAIDTPLHWDWLAGAFVLITLSIVAT